ncbi:MAG: ComEA family DNA-binding protein [Marvinbryantia sp.]|jgi:competence protein ComEA
MQKGKNKKRTAVAAVFALLLSGCQKESTPVFWEETTFVQTEQLSGQMTEVQMETIQSESRMLVVDISGAVVQPGVYRLPAGSRIYDAVAAAGGLLAEADLDALNQAELLQDAAKIKVLTEAEAETVPDTVIDTDISVQVSAKININTADITQLCTLSGIGESRAKDIIAYREQNGPFQAIEDIMKVNGIKDATFNKIKEEIEVG